MSTFSLAWWVAFAFAAQAAAANVAGFVRARSPRSHSSNWLRALAPYVRALWFVGVPYLALIAGVANPHLFALADVDGLLALQAGWHLIALTLVAGVLVIWLHARGALHTYPAFVLPASERRAQLTEPWGVCFIALDTIALQAHWLFYRAGAIVFLRDAYLGALGGMALVMAEWLVDLRWWQRVRTHGLSEDLFLQMALLLLTTLLAIYANDFWLMLIAHLFVWLGWLVWMQWCYRTLALQTGFNSSAVRDV